MGIRRQGALAATAAAATLTLLAPASGAASLGSFAGSAEALALELRLTAPAELLSAVLPDGGDTLVQRVSFTQAALSSDGAAQATTALLQGLLNEVRSSASGPAADQASLVDQDLGVLKVSAGTMEYVADAAAGLSRSVSELGHVRVTLEPLFTGGLLPEDVTAPIEDAVGQVTGVVNELVGELNTVLDTVEETVNEVLEQAPVDLPEVGVGDLPALPDITRVDLVEIRKMWSISTVTSTGELVRSETESGIAEASLLGGVVVVPAFQYRSWAQTAGTPGSADAGYDVTTIAVRIGGNEVGVSGTVLKVGDVELDLSDPQFAGLPVGELLGEVTGVLGDLLNTLGLSVAQGSGTTEVADDGSTASAATSAFSIRLTPLHAVGQDQLLDLQLDLLPTRAQVAAAPAPPPAPEQPPPAPGEPALPRTGGGLAAALLGAGLLAAAGGLRRRG